MKQCFRQKTAGLLATALLAGQCMPPMVSMAQLDIPTADSICLADSTSAAPIIIDGSSSELDGIVLNAEAFAGDIDLLTGSEPQIYKANVSDTAVEGIPQNTGTAVIVGTAEDPLIEKLVQEEKLNADKISEIKDGFEQYNIQVVDNPLEEVDHAVVITGSDKRGAIYGMYYVSQDLAGVSPWYYWGDVPVETCASLRLDKNDLEVTSKEPSVKFRGIFLNDEAPSLSSWVKKFGGYNQDFYDHVYELILRLKGNYLWPAMWSNSFSDDGTEIVNGVKDTLANAKHADAWGVVMGTSHHEPMCRAGVEWGRIWNKYGNKKDWNFFTNGEAISNFWKEGAERNQNFENVITIGMRGEADSPLVHEDGTAFTLAEQIEVLKQAVNAQKKSLQELGLADSPQMICLYKEVEEAWYGNETVEGLNKWDVLQNDIVMLCEDNHGNLRSLPTEEDKAYHKGGWGMYYHFDYHGGPRSYEWINTVPLEKVWNNMTMAYDYGIKDMWIVNVGDLKPMELPISYFLDMAYDFETWGTSQPNNQDAYVEQWVEQQFGKSEFSEEAKQDIAKMLHDYPSMSANRKPEIVAGDTFSEKNYNELQRKLAEAIDLEKRAEKWLEEIQGSEYEDAYYQLVYYPAAATANVYKMQLFSGLNDKYYRSGSMASNVYASLVAECVQKDKDLQDYYNNTLSGGKWNGMMSSPHVGYVAWNSNGWSYPVEKRVTPIDGAVMLVDVDGTSECLTAGEMSLPEFTSTGQECHALTISNGGNEKVNYTISCDKEWINIAAGQGSVNTARTLPVTVTWDKLSQSDTGTITVTSDTGKTVTVQVKATKLSTEGLEEKTYLAADGAIVIHAENYVSNSGEWKALKGLGRTGTSMKVFPTTSFFEPGKGPKLTYRVNIPEDGTYNLTVYVGPSNNIYADADVRYAVKIDDEALVVNNTIDEKFVAGDGNSWSNSIMMSGRTAATAHELKAGVHTISVYGVDAGLLLEKLVLSKEALKQSHMGPTETWYVGKECVQQPLIHYQTAESMTLPGTIYAVDSVNAEENELENGMLNAQSGRRYEYPVTVSAEGYYQFHVKGSSDSAAQVILKYGETEIGRVTLDNDSKLVSYDEGIDLKAESAVLTLETTGNAKIESVFVEKIDTEPGLPMTVFASSSADGSSLENAYDKKKTTKWEPLESDTAPYIGVDFEETVYTDWFKLNGSFDDVTAYEIQMRDGNTAEWTDIYKSDEAPTSGEKVYVQGTKACKGSQWRVVFHGENISVAEVEMSTYVNWSLEDEETTVELAKNAEAFANYKATSLRDGDRIASAENGAWIATGLGGSNKNYIVMTFGSKHTLSGVNVLAMQNAVLGSNWTGNEGEIPDDKLTSSHVRDYYQVFWKDENGSWQNAGKLNTTEKNVLSRIEFEAPVSTDAIKVVTGTNYAIRLAEIEAVESKKYTLDGVAEGYKNWALQENGGQVSVSSTFSQSSTFLNDGIRICGKANENRWRANKFPAWVEIQLPEMITVDAVNLFGQQNSSAPIEPTKELNNAYTYTPLVIQYWNDGRWVDGAVIAKNQFVWNQWKPENEINTDKIRLYFEKSVGDSFLRLSEVEVLGIQKEEKEEEDTEALINYALEENGGTVDQENGENGEKNKFGVIDNDITFNNGKRWRSNCGSGASSLTVKLEDKKEISKIDLITQQSDSAKVDGVYGVPDKNATTDLGIYKFNVYYNTATDSNADPVWELLEEVGKDKTGDGTNVWNSLELEESVITDKLKFEFPKNGGRKGWIRVIEIMVWGQELAEDIPEKKMYALTVEGGVIESIEGEKIGQEEGEAASGDSVVVIADEEDDDTIFKKWEVKLAPEGFSLASPSDATATFEMPEGDVTLNALYETITATPSNAAIVSKVTPEGWAYVQQDDLDDLLDDSDIITEADQDVLNKQGTVTVTLELLKKQTNDEKEILKAWSDEETWQIVFVGQNKLSKKVKTAAGSSESVTLASASNAVHVNMLIPQEWTGMEEDEYMVLSYTKEDGIYEVESISMEWLTDSQVQLEMPVNGSYALIVPIFYTVTFKDYDGAVLKTDKVKAGEDATPPETIPERDGYVFTGWSKEYTNVTKDITVKAKYSLVSNEEKLISRLEDILEEVCELEDEGPVENEKAVKNLIAQVKSIDFSGYTDNQEILDLLIEIEEEMYKILGINSTDVKSESSHIDDAEVEGTIFALDGEEGYLRIKDTSVPSRRPSGMEKLKNAFALDVKLYSSQGKVMPVKGLIRFTFDLPESVETDDSLVVIHYADDSERGKVMSFDTSGGTMTLVTDSLGIFTIGNVVEDDIDGDHDSNGGNGNNGGNDSNGGSGSNSGNGSSGSGSHGGGGHSSTHTGYSSNTSGTWKQNSTGWWYEEHDGSYPVNCWKSIRSKGNDVWYYFDNLGYMKTGWFTDIDGNFYYLETKKDHTEGKMVIGWQQIDGKWYYFNTVSDGKKGAMFKNCRTPDGYLLGSDGAWIKE